MLEAMVTLQLVIMVMILITMIMKIMMMVVVPVTMKLAEVVLVLLVVMMVLAMEMARNGAYLSENSDGNGIAVELDSDHELVATAEDCSEETILVSNTFPLSVH